MLACLLAVPTLLAYASPADQVWIRGVYDDADSDNIVTFLISSCGAVEPFPLGDLAPRGVVVGRAACVDEQALPATILSPHPPRAPPLS